MNTRLVGMMTSCRAPWAWFRASSMASMPSLRLSRSMLSVASSSEKRVEVGSRGSIHWSSSSPRAGERLHPDIRAKGDPSLVLSTSATTPGDPPAVSPFVRPSSGAVAWAAGGTDCVAPSDTTVATFDYAWLIMVTVTSACNAGASARGATPTTEGATSTSGGTVRSNVGGGITSAAMCSATPEDAS